MGGVGDAITTSLRVLAGVLIVPAGILAILALMSFLTGDGFSDAAPWCVFFAFCAFLLGPPGLLLLSLARWSHRRRAR
ncbi:MAG: hypothetical protein AB1714_13805 [Acidobacteriota bacterium]